MFYDANVFKSFYEPPKEADLPDIRVFCAKCGKPRQIAFDDLDDVYSRSDYCRCRGMR